MTWYTTFGRDQFLSPTLFPPFSSLMVRNAVAGALSRLVTSLVISLAKLLADLNNFLTAF